MARIDVGGLIDSCITFGQAFGKIDQAKAAELRAMAAEQKQQFAAAEVDIDFAAIDWTRLLDIVQKLLPVIIQLLPFIIALFAPKPAPVVQPSPLFTPPSPLTIK